MGLSCLDTDPEKRPATKEIIERLIGWGSTNFHVGSDERLPTLQIKSDPREFLVIDPRELQFCLGLKKRSRCLVRLTNSTEEHVAFSFGVKRARNDYIIEPTSGFLCPRSTFTVLVIMEELRALPSCNDEFLVQTIVVRGNIPTSHHNTDDSFNISNNVVHKEKLTVAYVPPAQSPTLLSDPQRLESFSDQETVDTLIRCICQDLGFSDGRPIAACIVYRCLLHWKSLESGNTNVFDRIIASMFSTVKARSNDMLAYWLSNSSTLLLLIQQTLKTATEGRVNHRRGKPIAEMFNMIFGGYRAFGGSHLIGGNGYLQKVEAKRPAQVFKEHLRGFLEKVYGMMRDNLVKEISPLLGCCIEAPIIICQALFDHWQSIVNILTEYLRVLKSNYVPSFLISKMFTQVFSFIDVQLFNSLLLSECCLFSDGEYIKAGLAKLEQWCTYETEEYAGYSWEELKHIRKAAIFLILSSMESLMTEDANEAVEYSLLLDDETASTPFSVDDILKLMTGYELTDVDLPALIRENPCFNFLHQRRD
ncbi:hypothetical protein ACQJBY_069349 [Aegilops geniculata]